MIRKKKKIGTEIGYLLLSTELCLIASIKSLRRLP